MKNRNNIFLSIFVGIIILSIPQISFNAAPKNKFKKITILFTNDTHSRIEPFRKNDKNFANLGGYARRAAFINQVRKEEKNVLLFDSGDVFQGTPYFNYFHGETEFELMSLMGYNAITIGNHEFDGGLEAFNYVIPLAKFDILSANYDFSETILNDKIQPYKVYTVDGIKVGVFGLGVAMKGLVDDFNYGKTKFIDPIVKASEVTFYLKKIKKCDIIICLSHLGYSYKDNQICDMNLAKQSKNIDLIIGGHTHTFMDKYAIIKNSDNKDVIIAQNGWGGSRIGRVDFYFTNYKHFKKD